MRNTTVTEKYNAVLEGTMAKKEFVRQMRQQFPMFVSNFDGFDSTVQILQTRNMLFEASKTSTTKAKIYDEKPALTYSLDALDRGIRAELGEADAITVNAAEYLAAEKKAKANLEKNPTHYLDLMAGESNKVDKHDKEVEVKRGEAATDTFNGLKNATLKEGYTEEQISSAVQRIKERRAGEHEDGTPKSNDEMGDDERENYYNDLDSIKERLTEKLSNPTLLGAVKQIKTMHPEVTSGIVDDFIDMHGQDILDGADPMDEFHNYIDANYEGPSDMREAEEGIDMSSKDGYISFIDNENILANYNIEDAEEMARELAMNHHDAGQDQDNFVKSFMAAYKEGGYDYDDQVHEKQGKDHEEGYNTDPNLQMYIDDEEWEKEMGRSVKEKKGKDHDGDGDIDGDDYMAAKDKAIKKAMGKDEKGMFHDPRMSSGNFDHLTSKEKEKQLKEAIKTIIKKSLITEAATVRLADWAEGYESFAGVKSVVNDLENIVTEIESFYDKMSDKIASTFEKTSAFENEEGLKIGGFIAPSLEAAFKQDLGKVMKKGSFFSKIQLPKVRTITQADVDANNSGERPLGETEVLEEPKSTVFTPNF